MADIIVLADFPIILTKDAHWQPDRTAKSGSIIRLPRRRHISNCETIKGDTGQ